MNKMKRILALALAAAISVGMLCGCSPKQEGTETPTEGTTEATEAVTAEKVDLSTIVEPVEYLSGLKPDTVVGTVGEAEITAEELMYWLCYTASYTVEQYYAMGLTDIHWDTDIGTGVTIGETMMGSAMELAAYYAVITDKAVNEYGLVAESESLDKLEESLAEVEAYFGSEEKALHYMWMNMTNPELYRGLLESSVLEAQLQEKLFGEGGEREPTDAEILAYAGDEWGYYGAKHILLSTVSDTEYTYDAEGNATGYAPLDEATIQEKKDLADQLLGKLRASGDPTTLFDSLMNEYSEDPGLASYPNGYLAYPGQMVESFEKAALDLKVGEISDVVESPYGYHIIMRTPLDPDEFRPDYLTVLGDQLAQEWLKETPLQTNENYAALEPATILSRLTAMQDAIYVELYIGEEPSTEAATEPAAETAPQG